MFSLLVFIVSAVRYDIEQYIYVEENQLFEPSFFHLFGLANKYWLFGWGQTFILKLKSQAPGSERLRCRLEEGNTFTASDYSLSILPATGAMDFAVERQGIKLFCSCKLILVIHVFLAHFIWNKIIKSDS